MRARGQRTRGTRGDPAELPRCPAVGYGGRTSGDFLAKGQTNTGTKQNTFEKRKTIRGEWAPLTVRSGLLSRCTQQGGTRTRRRGHKRYLQGTIMLIRLGHVKPVRLLITLYIENELSIVPPVFCLHFKQHIVS